MKRTPSQGSQTKKKKPPQHKVCSPSVQKDAGVDPLFDRKTIFHVVESKRGEVVLPEVHQKTARSGRWGQKGTSTIISKDRQAKKGLETKSKNGGGAVLVKRRRSTTKAEKNKVGGAGHASVELPPPGR